MTNNSGKPSLNGEIVKLALDLCESIIYSGPDCTIEGEIQHRADDLNQKLLALSQPQSGKEVIHEDEDYLRQRQEGEAYKSLQQENERLKEKLKVISNKLLQTDEELSSLKEQGDGWLPMESAPKDGTFILVYSQHDEEKGTAHKVSWMDDRNDPNDPFFCWCVADTWGDEQGGHFIITRPEGWRPLPQPPKS